jgi:hypothetical protein
MHPLAPKNGRIIEYGRNKGNNLKIKNEGNSNIKLKTEKTVI